MYDTGSAASNVDAYMRDEPIRKQIREEYSHEMNIDKDERKKGI